MIALYPLQGFCNFLHESLNYPLELKATQFWGDDFRGNGRLANTQGTAMTAYSPQSHLVSPE